MAARSGNVRVSIYTDYKGEKGVRTAEKDLGRLNAAGKKVGEGFAAMGAKAGAAIGGIIAVGTIKSAVKDVETLAKGTAALSRNTGLDTKTASEWVSTAKARGVEAAKLNTGFIALARNVTAANKGYDKQKDALKGLGNSQKDQKKANEIIAKGAGAQADAFKKLGVSQDALGKGHTNQILLEMADGFAALKDGPEKAALAQKLFGKQSQTLLPLLNGGRKALQENLDMTKKYGLTLDENGVKQSMKAVAAQRELNMAWSGVKIAIGTQVVPALATGLRATADFVGELRTGTGAGGEFRDKLSQGITYVKTAYQTSLAAVRGFLTAHKQDLQAIGNAMDKLGKLAVTIFNGQIVPSVKRAVAGLKQALDGLVQIVDGVVKVVGSLLRGDFGDAWDGVKDIFKGGVKVAIGVMREITAPARQLAVNAGKGIKAGFSAAWNGVKGLFSDGVNSALSALKSAGGKFSSAGHSLVSKLAGAFTSIPSKIKAAFGGIGGLAGDIGNAIRGWINDHTLFGDDINLGIKKIHIPALATGGRVPGAPVAADTVPALLSPQEFVVTGHGEKLLENMTFPGVLNWLQGAQMPHFATGGRVGSVFAGYQAGLEGNRTGLLSSALELIGEPNRIKSKAQKGSGGSAGIPAHATKVKKMLGVAASIASKGLPYTYGGGHGRLGAGAPGFDCSGFVSAVLGAGGAIGSPMAVRMPLAGALQRGDGKYVTVGIRGSSGKNAHTMMKIGSSYFESGGGHGPARVGGWSGSFEHFHPTGLRRGGRVGFRSGGSVRDVLAALSGAKNGKAKDLLRTLNGLLGKGGMSALLAYISSANSSLSSIRKGGVSKGEKSGYKGLQGAVSMLQGEYGRRLGTSVAQTDDMTDFGDMDDAQAAMLQIAGYDPNSGPGRQFVALQQDSHLKTLQGARAKLVGDLAKAKKSGSKKTVADISGKLKDMDSRILGQRATIVAAKPTQVDYLSAQAAQAQLTTGLGDDQAAAQANLSYRQQQYTAAQRGGDPRDIADAATNLKQAADDLDGINKSIADKEKQDKVDWSNADIALASLTDSLDDDISAYEKKKKLDEDALEEAKKTNDPVKIAEAANNLKADTDALKQLQQSVDDNTALQKQVADLTQTQVDNQQKIINLAQVQGPAMLAGIVAAVNGDIGGRVGLGIQSPGFSGGGVTY